MCKVYYKKRKENIEFLICNGSNSAYYCYTFNMKSKEIIGNWKKAKKSGEIKENRGKILS